MTTTMGNSQGCIVVQNDHTASLRVGRSLHIYGYLLIIIIKVIIITVIIITVIIITVIIITVIIITVIIIILLTYLKYHRLIGLMKAWWKQNNGYD